MKPSDVTYFTDGPARWREALDSATTFERLQETLREWREMFPDAYEARPKHEEFLEFRRGLLAERGGPVLRKKFAGNEWAERFGRVLIPERALRIAMLAQRFNVPWGTAFIRDAEVQSRP